MSLCPLSMGKAVFPQLLPPSFIQISCELKGEPATISSSAGIMNY